MVQSEYWRRNKHKKEIKNRFLRRNNHCNGQFGHPNYVVSIAMGIGRIAMHWIHCIANIGNIANVGNAKFSYSLRSWRILQEENGLRLFCINNRIIMIYKNLAKNYNTLTLYIFLTFSLLVTEKSLTPDGNVDSSTTPFFFKEFILTLMVLILWPVN